MAEQLIMRGELVGHNGWVTSLATSMEKYVPLRPNGEATIMAPKMRLTRPFAVPICCCQAAETRLCLYGTSREKKAATTDTPSAVYTAIPISSPTAYAQIFPPFLFIFGL